MNKTTKKILTGILLSFGAISILSSIVIASKLNKKHKKDDSIVIDDSKFYLNQGILTDDYYCQYWSDNDWRSAPHSISVENGITTFETGDLFYKASISLDKIFTIPKSYSTLRIDGINFPSIAELGYNHFKLRLNIQKDVSLYGFSLAGCYIDFTIDSSRIENGVWYCSLGDPMGNSYIEIAFGGTIYSVDDFNALLNSQGYDFWLPLFVTYVDSYSLISSYNTIAFKDICLY